VEDKSLSTEERPSCLEVEPESHGRALVRAMIDDLDPEVATTAMLDEIAMTADEQAKQTEAQWQMMLTGHPLLWELFWHMLEQEEKDGLIKLHVLRKDPKVARCTLCGLVGQRVAVCSPER
jgi:hypothetical protein